MGGLLYGGGAGAVAGAVDFAGDFAFTGAGAGECLCAVPGDRAVVFAGAVAGARWRWRGGGEKTPVCPAGGGGGMDHAASVGVWSSSWCDKGRCVGDVGDLFLLRLFRRGFVVIISWRRIINFVRHQRRRFAVFRRPVFSVTERRVPAIVIARLREVGFDCWENASVGDPIMERTDRAILGGRDVQHRRLIRGELLFTERDVGAESAVEDGRHGWEVEGGLGGA